MSAAGKECSIGMDTDASVGCALAPAANLLWSIFKDIKVKDDQTVGCASPVLLIYQGPMPRMSVTKMMRILWKHLTPLDLNLMGREKDEYWLAMPKKKAIINHTVRNIQ
jgi:hypothetical protein